MMQKIIDGLYILEGIGTAAVFVIDTPNGFMLVDSGIFKRTNALIAELENNGHPLAHLHTIVLTHCHCDHIGGVSELLKFSPAKVAAHAADIPFILQEKVIDGPYHKMMIQEQTAMRRLGCAVPRVDTALQDGETIAALGGLQIIQVPGHTPGSIALYQPEQRIMFFGDVIRNNPKNGLQVGIPEEFNLDTPQTRADARKLLQYPIETALLSHGTSILKDAGRIIPERLNYT